MLWGISYILLFVSFILCYRGILQVEIKNGPWLIGVVIGTCILGEILTYSLPSYISPLTMYICDLIGIMILTKASKLYTLLLYPIAFFIVLCVNILISFILSVVTGIQYTEFVGPQKWGLIVDAATPIPLLLFTHFSVKEKTDEKSHLSVPEYIGLLIGMSCMFLLIAVAQSIMKGNDTYFLLLKKPLAICVIVVALFFVGGIYWLSHINNRAMRYRTENMMYKQFMEQQTTHIKDILDADEKIRAFRHDIKAHIAALENGIEEGNLDFLRKYVDRMKDETKKGATERYSGIPPVDAIVSEWHRKAIEKGIQWEWEGMIGSNNKLEEFDLCVLISNLLSNAVEAAEKISDENKRFVSIKVGSILERTVIRVSNSCLPNDDSNKGLRTTKKDVKNHGFGSRNIQNIVEKVNGEIERKISEGVFEVEIFL